MARALLLGCVFVFFFWGGGGGGGFGKGLIGLEFSLCLPVVTGGLRVFLPVVTGGLRVFRGLEGRKGFLVS